MSTKLEHQSDLRPMLLELIEAGMRQAEIAREIGLSRATINFAVKKENGPWMPGYEAGRRLVNLVAKFRARKSCLVHRETRHG